MTPAYPVAKQSFIDLTRLLPIVLKRSGVVLIVLHFAREASLQALNYLGVLIQAQGREDMPTLVGLVGLNFFFEILWSAVWSFVLISATRAALRQEPLWSETSLGDLNQLLVEGVRSMAAILWRLPFAIIPGLIELLRLLFVPHVVLLEPLYAKGHVDALERSRKALKSKWFLVLIVTLLSLGLSSGVEALTGGSRTAIYFWQAPGAFMFSAVLTLSINLVYEVYLVAVFLRVNGRFADEA
jgi:hypothetical protein